MTVVLCVGAVSMSIVYEFRVECDGETKEVLGATKGTTFKIVCAVFSGNLTVEARLKKTPKGEKRRLRAIKDAYADKPRNRVSPLGTQPSAEGRMVLHLS